MIRFHRVSTNRLLTWWLCVALPLQLIVAWPLHMPGPSLLVGVGLWAAMRHLNRRAWKRHFRPRARA